MKKIIIISTIIFFFFIGSVSGLYEFQHYDLTNTQIKDIAGIDNRVYDANHVQIGKWLFSEASQTIQYNGYISNTSFDIYCNESIVFSANYGNGISAFQATGNDLTFLDSDDQGGFYYAVSGDGYYIFAGNLITYGLMLYTWDSTSNSLVYRDNCGTYAIKHLWVNDTFVFGATALNTLTAFTANENNTDELWFKGETDITATMTSIYDFYGFDDTLLVTGSNGLFAYTFDGTDFNLLGSNTSKAYYGVYYTNGYVYAGYEGGIDIFTFDGSNFLLVHNEANSYDNWEMYGYNGNLYVTLAIDGRIVYEAYGNTSVDIDQATNIQSTTASLNGEVLEGCSLPNKCGFWINDESTVDKDNYLQNITADGNYYAFDTFSYSVSGLNPGTKYYVRSWINNTNEFNFSSSTTNFLSRPEAPTNFTIDSITINTVNMTWDKGTGANNTIIVKKENSFPSTLTDGTVVYNDTGEWYNDSVSFVGQTIFYRAWSFTNWTEDGTTLNKYSTGYDDASSDFSGIILNVFNESSTNEITGWSVFISNKNGSKVYNETNCNNPHAILNSSVPYGDNTMIEISKAGYNSRIYYVDLEPGGIIFFNAYLISSTTSELYLLQVKNNIDQVVPDATLRFRHYINESTGFANVSSIVTDGEGQANIYLIPGELYKIIIEATGYDTGISDYYPSDSIFTHTLRIYFSNSTGEPKKYLFDNIVWNIDPLDPYHNGSIDLFYNISSSDSKLEWFNATVHMWNSTNETWVLLYAENITDQPTGGTIDYTITNIEGKYSFTCRFKKEDFNTYTFGTDESCRIYYVFREGLGSGLGDIAYVIYMLLTIVLMIAATGLLAYVGAGDASGIGAIGVMAVMFAYRPDLLIAGVSCWFVLLATVIVYGAYLWLVNGR